jgi:predicted AAA+ superfamily ATPase
LANIEKITEIPRLLALLASRLAELLNYTDLSRSLAIPLSTLKRYFALLEATFLVRLLPAWFANIGKRLTKSPKLLISDTGLVAYLLGLNLQGLQNNRERLGHLLENFVAMELIKQMGWATTRVRAYHFRTESGQEVDLILEDAAGRIVGIEVKAAVSLDAHDLRGLKALAELSGDRFIRGIVFYLGNVVVPFGKNLWAVPLSMAWR